MKHFPKLLTAVAVANVIGALPATAAAQGRSIPSVVVTVENAAPSRGAFQTPVWVGVHDGTFDIYDRNVALGDLGSNPQLVPAPAVERLAEDGSTGPISDEFSTLQPNGAQATLVGPSGPLAPSDRSSTTLNVDPSQARYFSYASMVIPSNDAFIANGSPLAHELFDVSGNFVGEDFQVAGSEILDAGTEVNDEIAANTAFINQGGPNIGVTENGTVVAHPGFLSGLSFPDGITNTPALGLANFADNPNYRAANVSFTYVDLGGVVRFTTSITPEQEVTAVVNDSNASGEGGLNAFNGDRAFLRFNFRGTTGPLVAAHLHLGQEGSNGPVVVDLGSGIGAQSVRARITGSDVVGPLSESDDPMLALLNELAAGNIYVNLHTAENPGGELRGQLHLRQGE